MITPCILSLFNTEINEVAPPNIAFMATPDRIILTGFIPSFQANVYMRKVAKIPPKKKPLKVLDMYILVLIALQ